ADNQQNQPDRTPQHNQRPPQLSVDVLFQAGELSGVAFSVFGVLVLEIELRKKLVGIGLCLGQGYSLFQAANQCQVISVVAEIVHNVGHEQIDLGARRKDRAKIECIRQHSDDHDRAVAQVDRLSDDARITAEAALPERIAY